MDIDKLTLGDLQSRLAEAEEIRKVLNMPAKQSSATVTDDDSHWEVGKNYMIRTVTHHLVGKLIKVTSKELVLIDAAWVADDGKFSAFVAKGEANEVEPYPDDRKVIVGRGALIDACLWEAALLRTVK